MTTTDTTWTCPSHGCGRTVVIYACPEDTAWLIRAAQERHAREHRAAAAVLARLPLGKRGAA